ncbi:MAG: DNA-binding protein [Nanoarchaeota archaeon]|nr:DNA-binding protein [Nanoarchaeota archaeon]
MAKKYKVCKECGILVESDVKECPNDKSNSFLEKYKGMAVVLNAKESNVAEKLNVKNNGLYALKY